MRNCGVWTFLCFFSIILSYSCSIPPDDESEELEPDNSTSELPWSGETDKFTINAKEGIRLNDPQEDAGTAYVTIPSSTVRSTRWEFGVRLTFNPSANNYARFYLASSSDVLSGNLNGYYIQIGGAKDNVALYRQNENKLKLLASGRELMKGDKSPKLYVKVECDANGYWTFWTRLESESEYTKEKQVKETSFQSSICSGIYCVYTKSRCDGFTFHHVHLSNDVETTTQPDDTPDDPDTPDTPDKPDDTEDPDDPDDTDNPDNSGLPENVRGSLLFNEIMYDNAKDGTEYIEIYNPSDKEISIASLVIYKMRETGQVFSTTILKQQDENKKLVFPAKGFLCFTRSASTLIRKHKVDGQTIIEVAKFPQLSNDGGYLALATGEEYPRTIDTCRFIDWMHDSKAKVHTGISLEKKSPELPSLNANWHSSKNTTGGTPGIKNS